MSVLAEAKIIGIHGMLNGGKDTVANYLITTAPRAYTKYAFAKPIKEACKVMFDFSDMQLEDRVLKEAVDSRWGFSPRRAMQLLGTEYGRDMMRKDVWIRRAEIECQKNWEMNKKTIITDVRFENEAEWLRSMPSSALIYIDSPDIVKDEKYNHASEAGIIRASTDLALVNDKRLGLNALYRSIDRLL